MKHLIRTVCYLALLLPATLYANDLIRVEKIGLGPERFNLEAHFSERVDAPVVRRHSNPLVHEFLLRGTSAAALAGLLNVGEHPLLDQVEVEQQRDDVLLRVSTTKPLEHLMSRMGEVMVLVFVASKKVPDAVAATTPAQPAPRSAPAEPAPSPQPPARDPELRTASAAYIATQNASNSTVTSINYFGLSGATGQLSIAFKGAEIEHELDASKQQLELTLFNTKLPDDLLYVLDVSKFDTPIGYVETFQEGRHARLKIAGKSDFRHQLEQLDGYLRLTFAERTEPKQAALDKNQKPISLNFQDVPVRQLLQILAEENQLNLVASESVTGNITLRLDNVPWERALETILRVKGLDKRIDGNILIVAPAVELAQREEQQLEANQRMAELAPLTSSYIQVNYAKAAEIAAILRTDSSDLLSSRGAVTVDERTNTLLVRDTQQQIDSVKAMVEVLDIPVKQVIIESRMVTVRDNISDELGIRWGITEPSVDTSLPLPWGSGTSITGDFNVNLPVSSPAATIGFQVAKLADGRLLDLELSALERENKGEIIASPRITTANQKAAYIEQGTEIPYVESASSGATSVQFKKAVLGLRVTPQITPDNRVILDLVITQNTRGETVTTPTGPAVSIDTQEIGTQVLVENGETIVLGGIYQQQILNDISKVPLLGDIPYVGVLFRTENQVNEKRELLIFVTPRIVTNNP
ncbi:MULTISPECIES: type IV pilus secretin PilQ [Pseudidiomarina]|uniref:Type IV pilus assembly protein PilQ n=2 Tax=Pseudidiomarina TaxID=2800384 RepID=A0A368URS8_9GAMM|nr:MULTISPECIES: type IV pilus secretin PilQ family protein [Pseudidiomarina]PWW10433.1 type IV pilus assembly protein PilQ [Pseudidiomarina maritima]RBP88073.1 type IV pilus assembly protein PilQ [Pseudidiomarina tainanensis]RCW30084.1 type IV pilus assembly protein PilQ [Pseudidiomarina tainanensis]